MSETAASPEVREEPCKKEIYTYNAPWTAYSLSWCRRGGPGGRFKLAVGSFIEEYANEIHIIQLQQDEESSLLPNTSSGNGGVFNKLSKLDHPYPPTKLMWSPASATNTKNDLLASSGDYLRLWSINSDNQGNMKALLNNNKHTEYCAPLTAFDWNETDPSMLATCSIDTTVTVWDLETVKPKTQLIAHDKEVYDVAFAPNDTHIFSTAGADGSVRLFDLRSLEHSTILYESKALNPLLRVSWNKQDPNYLACLSADSHKIAILDIRSPSLALCELTGHQASVNALSWAPQSSLHIASCADDRQALIWDISQRAPNKFEIEDPVLAYSAGAEINSMLWCKSHEDWIAISFDQQVQILKV